MHGDNVMNGTDYESVRRGLRLSQDELARRLGVSRQTIHKRETGKTPISREAVLAMKQVAWEAGVMLSRRYIAEPSQGRNEPCACGSGRKFKRCCGA